VANIHLRGIRPEIHDALRRRAAANGRSVNAEIVALVEGEIERDAERERLLRELRRLRREVRLPSDVLPPEQIIREARDERSRRL
jgi:plasmid stability protein